MKNLIIGLFACLCFTSCVPVNGKNDTFIVTGSTVTNIKTRATTYKIVAFDSDGYMGGIIKYRANIGTFEIGDTVVIVKK